VGSTVWTVFWFLVAIALLVTIHEYGHYWVARKLGFKVLRFSVGFGKPLLRRVSRGPDATEFVLAAIPLGGYVKLLDEREGNVPPEELHRSFTRKPPWQRILVLLAGPAANILFAIVVLWGIFWATGITHVKPIVGDVTVDSPAARAGLRSEDQIVSINGEATADRQDVLLALLNAVTTDGNATMSVRSRDGRVREVQLAVPDAAVRRTMTEPGQLLPRLGVAFALPPIPPVLGSVAPNSAAAKAGLASGDRIVAIDGQRIDDFTEIRAVIGMRPGAELVVSFERAGAAQNVRVTVDTAEENGKAIGRLGVGHAPGGALPDWMIERISLSPIAAFARAVQDAWDMTVLQAKFFAKMLTGQVSLKNLSGPISIAEYAGESADRGVGTFLNFLVLISLSLGFLNLLPIPILDGGQIVYASAEWVKGSPLSERAQAFGQQVGIALLVLLMGMAFFNDISRTLLGG
jgi:regulator of sigma E protease